MAAEEQAERQNRQLIELLNELRLALPGVQVLFAFLLTVPFTQRFDELSRFERDTYYAGLLCAAISSVLLIAPTAYHRMLFGHGQRAALIRTANRLAIAGLAFLALSMTAVIQLITHLLFGEVTAIAATVATAGMFVMAWYVLPLQRLLRHRD